MRIFTHVSVDLDAVCSVWAARRFIPGCASASLEFCPANWNGGGLQNDDIALDIEAGGKGLKGEQKDGVVHSCFALIINKYASTSDQEALKHIVRFVDVQDAYGSAVKHLVPNASPEAVEVLSRTGLGSVLRALQSASCGSDDLVVQCMSVILDGFLKNGHARIRAAKEADKAELIGNGKVAICRNFREYATNGILFDERGVQILIYVDGPNLGVLRNNALKVRTDHPALRAVVESTGELSEWFAHPAGFMFCRGSRKSPVNSKSRVDPRALAEAAVKLLQEM